jgi:hypothetical protein
MIIVDVRLRRIGLPIRYHSSIVVGGVVSTRTEGLVGLCVDCCSLPTERKISLK